MLNTTVASDGQTVILPDGQRFLFIWSGTISDAKPSTFVRYEDKMRATLQNCHKCDHKFAIGELHYNRRAPTASKKLKLYCLGCAVLIGMIEKA